MFRATHPVAIGAANLIALLSHLLPATTHARVAINEIMADPGSGEPEWIELHNSADTAVDLSGWVVHDRTSARPKLEDVSIAAGGYLVITRDSADLVATRTVASPIIELSFAALNNGGDDLVLRDASDAVVDSVPYRSSWGGDDGIALERIDPEGSSIDAENWGSSVDDDGATPGRPNSIRIVPVQRDLAITRFTYDYDRERFSTTILNAGAAASVGAVLELHFDADRDGLGSVDEILGGRAIDPIPAGDSIALTLTWPRPLTVDGEVALLELEHSDDERPDDNRASLLLRIPRTDTGVIISEFLYDPSDDTPEFIELYNRSNQPVDLEGWVIHDAGKSRPELPATTILPDAYLVVTTDTTRLREVYTIPSDVIEASLPALNNGGDLLVLRNRSGMALDSLRYTPSWGGDDGLSLERQSPFDPADTSSSWSSSLDPTGATPGRPNSVAAPVQNVALIGARFDRENSRIVVESRQTGVDPVRAGTLHLFADPLRDGRLVALGQHGIDLESDTTITLLDWTRPLTIEGERAVILFASESDARPADDTLTLMIGLPVLDTGVVVNEFMSDPIDDDPEWVELLNRTDQTVRIDNWRIADATGSSGAMPPRFLLPGTLIVITSDSLALRARFGAIPTPIVQVPMPTLNDNGDIIRIVDAEGKTVDSLRYGSTWGGIKGQSIERVEVFGQSSDPTTWRPSPDPLGGTPGRENAWRPTPFDLLILDLEHRQTEEGDTIVVRVLNLGDGSPSDDPIPDSITATIAVDINENGRAEPDERLGSRSVERPHPSDTITIDLPWSRPLTLAGETAIVLLSAEGDPTPENNVGSIVLRRAPVETGLVINELMIEPQGDEPEWVEIVNVGSEPVDVERWVLHDAGASRPKLPSTIIAPGSYLLATSDTAALRASRPILSSAPLIEFAMPTLNNGGDLVVLRNTGGAVVDSVRYHPTWGGSDGRSLERCDPDRPSDDSTCWSSSIDGSGATPGWENSTVPALVDLRIVDAVPDAEASQVSVRIENVGRNTIDEAEVSLYFDANSDGRPEDSEREVSQKIGPIDIGRSITADLPWYRTLVPETEPGIAVIDVFDDGRPDNNTLPFRIGEPLGTAGLIINEVMAAPDGTEPEWVEVYNSSDRTIDVDGWSIGDASAVVMLDERLLIPPDAYLLIATDVDLLFAARDVPLTAIIAEHPIPTLNNGGDLVRLIDPDGTVVDSMRFTAIGTTERGRSIERRHPELASDDGRTWRLVETDTSATPGEANGLLVPEIDGAVRGAMVDGATEEIVVTVINRGISPIDDGRLTVQRDDGRTSEYDIPRLELDDTVTIRHRSDPPTDLEQRTYLLRLVTPSDTIAGNDTLTLVIRREPPSDGLIITEIMPAPLPIGGDAGAEYVEVYNLNDRAVPLGGWSIVDGSGSVASVPESEVGVSVAPGTFGLIASDSTLFDRFEHLRDREGVVIIGRSLGLNDSEDTITLRNRRDDAVDGVRYHRGMYDPQVIDHRGTSLERLVFDRPALDTTDWSGSVAMLGGTPAAENSRRLKPAEGDATLSLGSRTISPDGDGFEDFVRIAWRLPRTATSISIEILDPSGHVVARPLTDRLVPSTGDVIFSGLDDLGMPLPIGPYLVRMYGDRVDVVEVVVVAGGRL